MRCLLNHSPAVKPDVSVILLDWSVRESYHSLAYLNGQNIDRNRYEIIWIEYYGTLASEIDEMLARNEARGEHPALDTWIVMDVPNEVCYHKHYMYNVGIAAAQGRIVCVCDSDAMFTPAFIQTIIDTFDSTDGIVLHMDEVRNVDKSHYPFDYPTFDQLREGDCINYQDGKTTGLYETADRIHFLNYGACMCARRDDLLAIGGADEHLDYLGHVCGPYDMTFRLVNHGLKEVWHEQEFLFHTWHPGSDGVGNYIGPHDGRNVSSRALEAVQSKRVMPALGNETISQLWLGKLSAWSLEELLDHMQQTTDLSRWVVDEVKLAISLGRSAFYRDDFSEAIRQWSRVERALPEESALWAELGLAYYFMKEHGRSLSSFNRALSINAADPVALRGRGWLHIVLGNFQQALEDFSAALPLLSASDRDPIKEVYRGRGMAHHRLGHYGEAVADLSVAITYTKPGFSAGLYDIYFILSRAAIHKASELGKQMYLAESRTSDVRHGVRGSYTVRMLKRIIRSHPYLYYLVRRVQALFYRATQNLKG